MHVSSINLFHGLSPSRSISASSPTTYLYFGDGSGHSDSGAGQEWHQICQVGRRRKVTATGLDWTRLTACIETSESAYSSEVDDAIDELESGSVPPSVGASPLKRKANIFADVQATKRPKTQVGTHPSRVIKPIS